MWGKKLIADIYQGRLSFDTLKRYFYYFSVNLLQGRYLCDRFMMSVLQVGPFSD